MSAFDLASAIQVGAASRVVVTAVTFRLQPVGSETVTLAIQYTDNANNPVKSDTVTYSAPAPLVAALHAQIATRLQAITGQAATLNAAAGA